MGERFEIPSFPASCRRRSNSRPKHPHHPLSSTFILKKIVGQTKAIIITRNWGIGGEINAL